MYTVFVYFFFKAFVIALLVASVEMKFDYVVVGFFRMPEKSGHE